MKVAVITRHAITNYGSLLQTIAIQQVIGELGHSCEIINYIRADESYLRYEFTLLKRKADWYHNPLKRFLYLALRQPESILTGIKFKKARYKYLKLTKEYATLNHLAWEQPAADVYMTGSDQVWGPVGNGTYDSAYCLAFIKEGEKKVAYGSSFGHGKMDDEQKDYYRKWLSRYSHITVREDRAVEMLREINIEAAQVLDPVFLPDTAWWNQYIRADYKKKYILVYQLHNNKALGVYARKVAQERGLPLVRISISLHQMVWEGKFIWAPGLGDFLSYIKNAECLITDSFHGTAFAINFNVPFVEVLTDNNTKSRNESLLRLTGLLHRILDDHDNIKLASEPVDFTTVNQILTDKRKESLAILQTMIEG